MTGSAIRMPIFINRPPVLTLWATVVAERLGHLPGTALTLGRAVAEALGSTRTRPIRGREDMPRFAAVSLLGRTIRLLPNEDGELRAAMRRKGTANEFLPTRPDGVRYYLDSAFGHHLADVRAAMDYLADHFEPAQLNRIGFRLYEEFRPEISPANSGTQAVLEIEKIRAGARPHDTQPSLGDTRRATAAVEKHQR